MFVKICGITSEEDALLAVAMGADALGFVFAAGSKRLVAPERVADIVRRLPPEVMTIGVFRNDLPERVVSLVERAGLRGAQLSGDERAEQAAWVKQRVELTIQAFPAGDPFIDRARDFDVDVIMIDNANPGSGEVFDWSLVDGVPDGKPLLLAGGLTPANVGRAIQVVHPWGVDVSTGVESAPGVKDPRKVKAFVRNARAAAPDDDRENDLDGDGVVPGYGAADAGRPVLYDWEEDA